MFIPQKIKYTKEFKDLKSSQKHLLRVLYELSNESYSTRDFASLKVLMFETDLGKTKIEEIIKHLVNTNFIKLKEHTGYSNEYIMNIDETKFTYLRVENRVKSKGTFSGSNFKSNTPHSETEMGDHIQNLSTLPHSETETVIDIELNTLNNNTEYKLKTEELSNNIKNTNYINDILKGENMKYKNIQDIKDYVNKLNIDISEKNNLIRQIDFALANNNNIEAMQQINNIISIINDIYNTTINTAEAVIYYQEQEIPFNNISDELPFTVDFIGSDSSIANDIIDTNTTLTSISDEFNTSYALSEQDEKVLIYHLDNINTYPSILNVILDNNNWMKCLKHNYTKFEKHIVNHDKLKTKVINY